MSLAHFYGSIYNREGKNPERLRGNERFNYFGTGSPLEERLELFTRAVHALEDGFGTWDTPWGEINRLQRLDGEINMTYDDDKPSLAVGMGSSTWGALASFGARASENTNRIYGAYGNSFVAVVEFGDKVKAKSMLAGGQSGDPKSPHFYDQGQRYADGEFKDVAFYKTDVLARAKRTYKPGKE